MLLEEANVLGLIGLVMSQHGLLLLSRHVCVVRAGLGLNDDKLRIRLRQVEAWSRLVHLVLLRIELMNNLMKGNYKHKTCISSDPD